jgi:hypothetical protein
VTGAPAPIGAGRLAVLLIRARLRSFRNGLRARGRRRAPLFLVAAGLLISFAYVGLFAQAFSTVVATVGLPGQAAALAVVAGTIALGSLAAKAASNEAVRAGSPENEFLLARPVSLAALVAGRGIADAVTDPMGALFLFPALVAAALVWRLPPAGWLTAAVISSAAQVAISMLAYATQLAVVRAVPARRRRLVWMGLRLGAALSLAGLWMASTWILRAPAAMARHLESSASWLAWTPGGWLAAPLVALVRGEVGGAVAGLVRVWGAALAALLLAAAIARRAGMHGWEEAGTPWAESAPAPRLTRRPPTAATKDLRLIVRDRSQLLVLIAMPAIFVGVQIFGSAGWAWSTASLTRVACLAYSLALYMATIGPLTHMQAERRAFWILRTVPVPLGALLAAKARAWSVVVGGAALFAFVPLAAIMPPAPLGAVVATGCLVVGGAVAMSFLAVAMAAGGADLSDDQSAAVGPATIYAFLLVGGLYNLVLTGDTTTRLAGLALYLFVLAADWQAGVARAEICLDAEAVRARELRAADGATLLLIATLGLRGAVVAGANSGQPRLLLWIGGGLQLLLGAVAARLLPRAPPPERRWPVWLAVGVGVLTGGLAARLVGTDGASWPPGTARWPLAIAVGLALLGEEAIFSGVIQRISERSLEASGRAPWAVTAGAAAATIGLRVISLAVIFGQVAPRVLVFPIVACVARAATGRVSAAWAARVVAVALPAFF